ncbi:c(7)-type cytochrome triheme domain-containing protein [Desulfobulbus oligotrophicus]|uniref:Cytochrome c7-like domain-containing protein n=1 Tax=Desulfobulbus oligotrophicus TaxID=1909699 RepID=A0A7T5VDS8_9BACT|nr:c(7)-type cytochrome triheme domain-containing protein [Desulfobulbus oligotrophicus]QQG66042.1 hypothetical protein HP555_09255 [Desulfobulbus oligotrophicus]
MKGKTLLMAAWGVIFAAGILFASDKDATVPSEPAQEAAAAKEYESFGDTKIVIMEAVKDMFSHNSHVVTAGISCESCHPSLFERKRGAGKAKGDYNHTSFDAGKYCGACHDGDAAFSTTGQQSCKVCHGSDMQQPEIIVFNRPVKGVVFDHKGHVDMGLNCASCHDKEFEMRIGAAEETAHKFHMQAMYRGQYCGVCHNGNIAFAANTRCTTCHIGIKGVEKMLKKKNGDFEKKG